QERYRLEEIGLAGAVRPGQHHRPRIEGERQGAVVAEVGELQSGNVHRRSCRRICRKGTLVGVHGVDRFPCGRAMASATAGAMITTAARAGAIRPWLRNGATTAVPIEIVPVMKRPISAEARASLAPAALIAATKPVGP